MPQVKEKIADGVYENVATDAEGKPRALSLGAALTFKPGQKRQLKGSFVAQSRATFEAFKKAMANGTLKKAGAPTKAAPPPPPPPPPPPVEDPPPPPPPAEEEVKESAVTKAKRARRQRKKDDD